MRMDCYKLSPAQILKEVEVGLITTPMNFKCSIDQYFEVKVQIYLMLTWGITNGMRADLVMTMWAWRNGSIAYGNDRVGLAVSNENIGRLKGEYNRPQFHSK